MDDLERYSGLIAEHRAELERMGVTTASIVGSVGRGDSTPASDVDVVVDYDSSVVRTTYDLVRIQRRLQGWLGREVDIISWKGLTVPKHSGIFRDAKVVF